VPYYCFCLLDLQKKFPYTLTTGISVRSVEFKPRLEKILRDVIVLSEVAELAMEAEILEASSNVDSEAAPSVREEPPRREERHSTRGSILGAPAAFVHWSPTLTTSGRHRVFSQSQDGDGRDDDEDSISSKSQASDDDDDDDEGNSLGGNRNTPSGNLEMINLLEHWEEPKNAMDKVRWTTLHISFRAKSVSHLICLVLARLSKTSNTSINDILKFRRALSFMDDAQLFGGAFGPAHNRETVVRSAEYVFRRLLTLTPGNDALAFEALEMLAHEGDVDGPLDRSKLKTIKRMFRPDKDNSLSRLDFVKACDGLYKKLRFFRASVGNASVIDHHLESIIDSIFLFHSTIDDSFPNGLESVAFVGFDFHSTGFDFIRSWIQCEQVY